MSKTPGMIHPEAKFLSSCEPVISDKLSASKIQWCDADPGLRGPCVVAAMNKFTWTTEVLWRKGMAWPLSK